MKNVVIPAGLRHQITLHAGYSEVDDVDDPHDGEECIAFE